MTGRRERLGVRIDTFIPQYRRPKRPGKGEPNDRKYDLQVARLVKRMDPQELDAYLRGDELSDERDTPRPS